MIKQSPCNFLLTSRAKIRVQYLKLDVLAIISFISFHEPLQSRYLLRSFSDGLQSASPTCTCISRYTLSISSTFTFDCDCSARLSPHLRFGTVKPSQPVKQTQIILRFIIDYEMFLLLFFSPDGFFIGFILIFTFLSMTSKVMIGVSPVLADLNLGNCKTDLF